MPDFKFRKGRMYFSILNDSNGKHPLLIPIINNPDFIDTQTFKIKSPPGIIQLLQGDLGITEMVMGKVLAPVLNTITSNVALAEQYANMVFPDERFPEILERVKGEAAAQKAVTNFIKSVIPKDSGLKSFEKTVISSLMDSHKPLVELLKILIELLAIAEDVVCMFLGTSIKVFGKNIGFPSRNPAYWNKSLGYATTLTYALKEFDKAIDATVEEYNKRTNDGHPFKNMVPDSNESTAANTQTDDRDALYVAYFDHEGVAVEPPKWVYDSNKWFKRTIPDKHNKTSVIQAPFERLSTDITEGVRQLRDAHMKSIDKLDAERDRLMAEFDGRLAGFASMGLSEEALLAEAQAIELEKGEATQTIDGFRALLVDMLDGTNVSGENNADEENPNSGANTPELLNEWMGKTRGSQLRQKYFPAMEGTAQALVGSDGTVREPYVYIPKARVDYNGEMVEVEVPLAFKSQIGQEETDGDAYYDSASNRMRNTVAGVDMYAGTDTIKPYLDQEITHFSHNRKLEYVPDAIKNFYLPLEWEEVSEYEVRNKTTGQLIRTEQEVVTHRLDLEGDYELRLIKVINRNLGSSPETDNTLLGTTGNRGNNIPEPMALGEDGSVVAGNLHSTPDINPDNLLKEGIVRHGVDPRFPNTTRYPHFWLVEAIRKDERGIAPINKEYNSKEVDYHTEQSTETGSAISGKKGKEWYGLLDKFKAIPKIIAKLVPLLIKKAIPLIIKIIKLVSNPKKIMDFLIELGITDEAISKFPAAFKMFSKEGLAEIDRHKDRTIPGSFEEAASATAPKGKHFYANVQAGVKNPKIISLIDGQSLVSFGLGAFGKSIIDFGVDLRAADTTKFKVIREKVGQVDFTKEPPVREQPIFTLILTFLKLPFEVLFKIFMWFVKWFKKLLNPLKIPKAIIELLSFKWLRDIIGKKSLLGILGMEDALASVGVGDAGEIASSLVDSFIDGLSGEDTEKRMRDYVEALRGNASLDENAHLIEVLVYNIYRNGEYLRSETKERPFSGSRPYNATAGDTTANGGASGAAGGGAGTSAGTSGAGAAGATGGTGQGDGDKRYGNDEFRKVCGMRDFSLNDLFPIPFWSEMPKFNLCELPIIFLKPLEMVHSLLVLIQEVLNGFISMPVAILGLEPTLKLPRFGKEIPFADVFEAILNRLKERFGENPRFNLAY